jgi:hypothetical protein
MAGAGVWRRWPERGGWPGRSDGEDAQGRRAGASGVAGGGGRRGGASGGGAWAGGARGLAARVAGGTGAAREGRRRERRAVEIWDRKCEEEKKRGRRPIYYSTALPSARSRALGKELFKNIKIHFAECRQTGTRQTLTYLFLPSAARLALGKVCFAECLLWTLGKVCFLFFLFPIKLFLVCSYTM